MKFVKLRLSGFKSFVDPGEFLMEPGLTGIVGPNGCGKSNLVEALRWVMGESSYKAMRAAGMDEVIFSGSLNRPARNTAEVVVTLDNADRSAPSAFNDLETLEVSRRIERESGSTYRVNGREVRARDVHLLFADASTGARSPSLVRQGQIGELIAAKPQARRAILEEAAGITGLHGRRHEAELRLRGAEQNLDRLEDVLTEIESHLDGLKRQARQATRYRNLSGEIRRAEATLLHLRWRAACDQAGEAEQALTAARGIVAERAGAQAAAARDQAVAGHELPPLRDGEARAAAALQKLTLTRNALDAEEAQARHRLADLDRRLEQFGHDLDREQSLISENQSVLERLTEEESWLKAEVDGAAGREAEAEARRTETGAALAESEAAFGRATAEAAEIEAERRQLENAARDTATRLARLDRERQALRENRAAIEAKIAERADHGALNTAVNEAESALATAEAAAGDAEAAAAAARDAEAAARPLLAEAERHAERLEAEAETLRRVLGSDDRAAFRPVIDAVKVAPGFEAALGAALGDDLNAALDAAAPAHWAGALPLPTDPALPEGVDSLNDHVTAPPALARRLQQIGLVDRRDGAGLQSLLMPGQRLVSREGDLWRWDGFVASADAPTAATQRLAQKNRLDEIAAAQSRAVGERDDLRQRVQSLQTAVEAAIGHERECREHWRATQTALAEAREALSAAERQSGELNARMMAIEDAEGRMDEAIAEAERTGAAAEKALAEAPDPSAFKTRLEELRAKVETDRAADAEARAAADGLQREAKLRGERVAAIARDRANWQARIANAESHIATLSTRRAEAEQERARLADLPDEIDQRRRRLLDDIGVAEKARQDAADLLAAAESRRAEADRAAAVALTALAEAKEGQARAEERLTAAAERRTDIEQRIAEALDVAPHETRSLAGLDDVETLPAVDAVETRLERLRLERERLGGVNLRADEEAREIAARRDAMIGERDDLVEAIRRLRQGIQSLDREGRERLLVAFERVDAHFRELFHKLFGGGTAQLMLIESDDPLEAGLEIIAKPPGKKPQTLTLLSGGEQALTALALIFAVFLTNPAPICVLDEVDAPLDDANVERFCDLVDEMTRLTETRFVIVTHNPITMSRMDRLFGVTMSERGVSQLVSVDLQTAEGYREAS